MPNRLAHALSPYLQQHADNPVDWFEWGEEAFAEAARRDVPVLLSVGYAACHWCHVMAHESFEDPLAAARMNEGLVNVKVDREERPDVDSVYMAATVGLTGRGGWPMTVFLTPQGRPFHAGTYYPPRPAHGMPSFGQLLDAVTVTWRERRAEVLEAAERISEQLAGRDLLADAGVLGPVGEQAARPLPDEAGQAAAVRALVAAEDRAHGGFGTSMKFPQSPVLGFLLRHAARRTLVAGGPQVLEPHDSGAQALGVLGRALHAMAGSGMYDQLAGGFARYAVDRVWVVPHFEKMLDDNAQLASVYLGWHLLTGDPLGARVAAQTCEWMLAELRTAEGGFAASLDADTPVPDASGAVHGVEGATYVWTPAQLAQALGEDDGAWVAQLCGVTAEGTFEHGTSTLQLLRPVEAPGSEEDAARWARLRARLAALRASRPQPARDDKVVTGWNGLAVAALARTGAALGRPEFVEAAVACADLLLARHLDEHGRLRRASREGRVGEAAAVLADHGQLAEGLQALHAVTGEAAWLEVAGVLLDGVLDRFLRRDGDGAVIGFHDTADDATDAALAVLGRPGDPTDGAQPSGWTSATGALLAQAALTGQERYRDAAEAGLALTAKVGTRAPEGFGWGLAVAEAWLDGPRELAVAGPDVADLHRVAVLATAPGLVVSVGAPDAEGVPLLAGRGDAPTRAFVCRGFVCDAPTSDPAVLAASVGAWNA
ncbi:MAG: thioredoxin domain-containing protein [Kineosporiaceae bacterium]